MEPLKKCQKVLKLIQTGALLITKTRASGVYSGITSDSGTLNEHWAFVCCCIMMSFYAILPIFQAAGVRGMALRGLDHSLRVSL